MSAPSQRMRKSSPSCPKQGPMRATLPVSSLLRQNRGPAHHQGNDQNSPTSPTISISPSQNGGHQARISPETSSITSGQRSPGSLSYKGHFAAKSKTLSGRCDGLNNQSIRRTASLDTIYLKGQWPRDSFYPTSLFVDKATQTEEWTNEPRSEATQRSKTHSARHTASEQTIPDEKLEKYFKHRLQRTTKEGTSSRERTVAFGLIMPSTPVTGDHSVLPSIASQTLSHISAKSNPMNLSLKPMRPPMRSSIEGLNQEIEGLVLKSNNGSESDHQIDDKFNSRFQMTPEGHRAPLAELFRGNRNVSSVNANTQTPATDFPSSSYSSGPPSRNSDSPIIPGSVDASRPSSELLQGGSRGSTPDHDRESGRLGTSPQINKFLAREPPDGCEKVNTKLVEDVRRPTADLSKLEYCSKPLVAFQLKPSLGSAFLPLHQQPSNGNSPSRATLTPPPNS